MGKIGEVRIEVKVDPSGVAPGLQAAKHEAQKAGVEVGDAFGVHAGHGLVGGLFKARRFFHHAMLGLFAVPFVVEESMKLGEKIGDALLVALGRAGTKAVEQAEKEAEEFQIRIGEALRKTADKANASGGAQTDSDGLLAKKKQLAEITKEQNKLLERRAGLDDQLAHNEDDMVRGDRIKVQNKIDETEVRRKALEDEVVGINKRNQGIVKSAEAEKKAGEVAKLNAEEKKAQNAANEKAQVDLFKRLDEGAEASEQWRKNAERQNDETDRAEYHDAQEQAARQYEAWKLQYDATIALTKAVTVATDQMRSQQSNATNDMLATISTTLSELRTITQLRQPRR